MQVRDDAILGAPLDDLFARFMRGSADAVALTRLADGRIAEANEAFLRMIGFERSEAIGRTTEELRLWVEPGERQILVRRLREERVARSEIFRLRTRTGEVRTVEMTAQLLEIGGEAYVLAIDRDVTDRERADANLLQSQEMLRATIESTADGILVVDNDGQTTHANARFAEMWRIPPDLSAANSDEELLAFVLDQLEDPDAFLARVHALYRTGLTDLDTLHFKDRRVFERYSRPLMNDGRVAGRVWSFRDITQQKEAKDKLEDAWQRELEAGRRLRALDEMKNTFLEAVSHELRTPLTTILGSALTLERDDVKLAPGEVKDLVGRMATNARKLNRLLSDLLDLDRLSRGIVEPKLQVTDVAVLTRQVIAEAELVGEHALEIETTPAVVEVDPAKVERIVENLVVNASRHTPSGTPIWVRVVPEDGGVLICVDDSGPGVQEADRRQIFEPFHQAPGTQPHAPGVGIGLSLVARFTEIHGGRAWVQERPGGGSSFRVFLPGGHSARP